MSVFDLLKNRQKAKKKQAQLDTFKWKTDGVPSPAPFLDAMTAAVAWAKRENIPLSQGHFGVLYSYSDDKFLRDTSREGVDPLGAWLLQNQPDYKSVMGESPYGYEAVISKAFKVPYYEDLGTAMPACIGAFARGYDDPKLYPEAHWGDSLEWFNAGRAFRTNLENTVETDETTR